MKSITCSAPGRICLAGEDLDWSLGPSMLCAVSMRTYVTVTEIPSEKIIRIFTNYGNTSVEFQIDDLDKISNRYTAFVVACLVFVKDLGVKLTGIFIEVMGNVPVAAGLSSSAALILAVLKALLTYYRVHVSDMELCRYAYSVEHDVLKRNVGQMDLYSCGLGGVIYINSCCCPPKEIVRYDVPDETYIMVIDTLTFRNTSDVIKLKRERFFAGEESFMRYLSGCCEIIAEMKSIFDVNPSLLKIEDLLFRCQEILRKDLNVSNKLINDCIDICRNGGFSGAKITGTGFGGCVFAILDSRKAYNVLTGKLKSFPVKVYLAKIDTTGVIQEVKGGVL